MSLTRPLTWTLSMLLLAVAALALSRVGAAAPLQSVFGHLFSPAEGAVHAVFAPVGDFIANAGSYGQLRQDNRDLRAQNERLQTSLTQLQEQQAQQTQNTALQQSAQLFPNADFVQANVIARGPGNIHDTVELDKGSSDGIQSGMVVVGKGGALLGTVYQANGGSSWVRLITDPDSDVNAVDQQSRTTAIISGALQHRLQMQFVQVNQDVQAGDTVITSGLGGNYPKDLLIGRVSKVTGGSNDLFKTISVNPAVQPDTLEGVLVMTSFLPSRPGTGQ